MCDQRKVNQQSSRLGLDPMSCWCYRSELESGLSADAISHIQGICLWFVSPPTLQCDVIMQLLPIRVIRSVHATISSRQNTCGMHSQIPQGYANAATLQASQDSPSVRVVKVWNPSAKDFSSGFIHLRKKTQQKGSSGTLNVGSSGSSR